MTELELRLWRLVEPTVVKVYEATTERQVAICIWVVVAMLFSYRIARDLWRGR